MGFRCGTIALVGRPNVGKSTLLNAIVGQKVSIVSNKPQTTRRNAIGVAQLDDAQLVFVDTPGIHEPHTKLGKAMVSAAKGALTEVNLILIVVDGSHTPNEEDRRLAELVIRAGGEARRFLCINKMDRIEAEDLIERCDAYAKLFQPEDWLLTTATRAHNLDKLTRAIADRLPEAEPMFPPDEFTDQPLKLMAAEIIREKILTTTRQEVPHATAVLVEEWSEEPGLVRIRATITVEKASQRAILLGKHGATIKALGTAARLDIEHLVGNRVHLELHVDVRENWRMNPRDLRELDYTD